MSELNLTGDTNTLGKVKITLSSSDPFAYCLKIFYDSLNIIFIIYRWTILSILGLRVESLHWLAP